jgi:DNA modification methylase
VDVWPIKKINPQSMVHLTEKPVELATRALEYSSRPGENVLDLFGGSGSTLIAAEQGGRRAFLMELDPLYCDPQFLEALSKGLRASKPRTISSAHLVCDRPVSNRRQATSSPAVDKD